MSNKPFTLLSALLLTAALAACNLPSAQTNAGPSVEQQAATIVAATINAQTGGGAGQTPFASPVPPTATTKPTLFVNAANAKCRSGPGPDFQVVATYPAGTSVDLVGKDSAASYWIVQDPTSHSQCWVQVQDATPAGSFGNLPEMTPQPITASVPGKPSRGPWNFSCDNTTLTTILGWNNTTGTANGFRVYRQGNQIADLPATQKTYTEKIPFTYGSSMQYAVAAYNEAGTSPQLTWDFHCP